ncbi:MAG: ferredoxin III, nif-specific [Magnetococcales bacterium]|nr:ferredoxin III, nif-specific [Magnetococcales bacterium]
MVQAGMTSITRGGRSWTPTYVTALNGKRCIGCGRCFKVCPRQVFDLVDRELAGDDADDEEDGFSDEPHKVMVIHDGDDCIGCAACARVCPKKCHTHAAMPMAA